MPDDNALSWQQKVERLWELREIETLLNNYSRAFDRCDLAGAMDTYWPDALDDHPGFVGTGHAMCAHADKLHLAQFDHTQHYITNTSIDLVGDMAHTESYYIWTARLKHAFETVVAGGRYLRRLERRKGVWRIAATICTSEWSTNSEAARQLIAASAQPSRDRTDFVYRRPLEVDIAAVRPGVSFDGND